MMNNFNINFENYALMYQNDLRPKLKMYVMNRDCEIGGIPFNDICEIEYHLGAIERIVNKNGAKIGNNNPE